VSHRRTRLWCLLALTLVPALAAGQTIKMPDKIEVTKNKLSDPIVIEWEGDDFKYSSSSTIKVFREYDPDPKKVVLRVIGYDEGRGAVYAVSALAKDGKAKLSDFKKLVVVVGSGATDPTRPRPDTNTGPVTKADSLFVLVVEETGNPFPNRARLVDALYTWANGNNNPDDKQFWAIDKDVKDRRGQTPDKYKDAIKRAAGETLPRLLIYDGKGNFLADLDLPSDPGKAVDLVNSYKK
jgi:hypothetical protein